MGLLPLPFSGLLCSSQQQQQKPETAWPCPRCGDSPPWHPAHGQDVSREDRHWDGMGPDGARWDRGSTVSRLLDNLERKDAFVLVLCFKGFVT